MTDLPTIHVLRPGALTLVQDLGRPGYGASGVPRGGAFDSWAARAANRLVGNPDGAALFEVTLAGPTLELEGVAAVAWVGDPFELTIETGSGSETHAEAAPHGETLLLSGRSRIAIGRADSGARGAGGARGWFAVAGGIAVPIVLGSRSTDLAGGFGGFAGRALAAGDRLTCLAADSGKLRSRRFEPPAGDNMPPRLRIVRGPDEALLAAGGLSALASREFVVTAHSDRRGIRLAGAELALVPHPPLRSQGTLPGAVQIPPSGLPIVLGVDAPVTGGYPWVAQVIEADLAHLAHLAPGARVRFELVDFTTAERALTERRARFEAELPRG